MNKIDKLFQMSIGCIFLVSSGFIFGMIRASGDSNLLVTSFPIIIFIIGVIILLNRDKKMKLNYVKDK